VRRRLAVDLVALAAAALGVSSFAASTRASAGEPGETPRAEEDGGVPPPAPSTTASPPPPPDPYPFVVTASGAMDVGTLPRDSFGFGGGVALSARPFRLEGTIAYFPTATTRNAGTGAGGSFALLLTEIRACALVTPSFLSLGGCAGIAFSNMQAETFDTQSTVSSSASWSSFVVDALIVAHVAGPLSLRVDPGLVAPFSRPTFTVDNVLVLQPSSAAFDLTAGAEVIF
jgi:hypothetical protein